MDITEAKRAILQEWEKDYAELGLMIARLRRELGMTEESAPSSTADPNTPSSTGVRIGKINVGELVSPGDLFGKTQVLAVRMFLDRAQQPASLREIAQALYRGKATDHLIEGAGALRNLSSVLSRAKEFVSVAHGYWGLVEWYPDRAVRRARTSRDQGSGVTESEGGNGGA
jgi:hypothetical protein